MLVYVPVKTADGDLVTLATAGYVKRNDCIDDLLRIIQDDFTDLDAGEEYANGKVSLARDTFAEKDLFVCETNEYAILEVTIDLDVTP